MEKSVDSFWDGLTQEEGEATEAILRDLTELKWAKQLPCKIDQNGGIVCENKALFFECRFGHALHQASIEPEYEVPGVGASTLDFGFMSDGQKWRVELMSLRETQAARDATREYRDEYGTYWSERGLSTNLDAPKASQEGETLKAVERICQKCERAGKPHKFPDPDDAYHAIIVDFRTFQTMGGDEHDRVHVALGGECVREEYRQYWNQHLVAGVFSPRNSLRGAAEARDRVHFIGFVNEKTYRPGEFAAVTQFIANPHLFADAAAMHAAIATWPLQPAKVLNSLLRRLEPEGR